MTLEETKKYLEDQLSEIERLLIDVSNRRKTVKIKAAVNCLGIIREHIKRRIFHLKENLTATSASLVLEKETYDPIIEFWTRTISIQKSDDK